MTLKSNVGKQMSSEEIFDFINSNIENITIVGKNGTGKSHILKEFFLNNYESIDYQVLLDEPKENLNFLSFLIEKITHFWGDSNDFHKNNNFRYGYMIRRDLFNDFSHFGHSKYLVELTLFVKNFQNVTAPVIMPNSGSVFNLPNYNDLLKQLRFFFTLLAGTSEETFAKMMEFLQINRTSTNYGFGIEETKSIFNFINMMINLQKNDSDIKNIYGLYVINKNEGQYSSKNGKYYRDIFGKSVEVNSEMVPEKIRTVTKNVKHNSSKKEILATDTDLSKEFIESLGKNLIDFIWHSNSRFGQGNQWIFTIKMYHLISDLIANIIKNELDECRVLTNFIIDEPESSLHETLEKELGKFLKNISISNSFLTIGYRSIITTHSRIMVNSIVEEITQILFTKANDINKRNPSYSTFRYDHRPSDELFSEFKKIDLSSIGKSINSIKISYLEYYNESFKKVFQINKDISNNIISSFFYDCIIICEGENDKLFLSYMINEKNQDDILIIPAWGKLNAIAMYFLLSSFNVNAYLFVDSDINGKDTEREHKFKMLNDLLTTTKHYKFEPDIENHLLKLDEVLFEHAFDLKNLNGSEKQANIKNSFKLLMNLLFENRTISKLEPDLVKLGYYGEILERLESFKKLVNLALIELRKWFANDDLLKIINESVEKVGEQNINY